MNKRKLLRLSIGWSHGVDDAYSIDFMPHTKPPTPWLEVSDAAAYPILTSAGTKHVIIISGAPYASKVDRMGVRARRGSRTLSSQGTMELQKADFLDTAVGLTEYDNAPKQWQRAFWRDHLKYCWRTFKYGKLWDEYIRPAAIVLASLTVYHLLVSYV